MDPRLQSQVVRTVQPQILQLCLREGGRKEGEGRREKGRKGEGERKKGRGRRVNIAS